MKILLVLLSVSLSAYAQESTLNETTLDPVVISSDVSKQSNPSIVAPGSYVKKDHAASQEKATKSLKDLLNQEPNIEFVGGPRSNAELPQIRGLGSDRILILDEGVRQNFQSGHNGRIFVGFSLLENLEVVKGPWSALYGSGAMGGVISFRRSTAYDLIRRSGQNSGVVLAVDGGSASDQLGERLTAFTKSGIFEPLISYHSSKNNDLRLADNRQLPFSAADSSDIYSSLGFRFSDQQVLHIKLNQRHENTVVPLNPVTETTLPNQLGDTTNLKQDFVTDYVLEAEGFDLHAKPYYRRTQVTKARVSDGREDKQIVDTLGIDTWTNLNFSPSDSFKAVTTVGIEYFQDRNKGERDGAALSTFPNATSNQWGIYLQPTMTLSKKWNIVPGFRYDSFHREDSTGQVAQKDGGQTSAKLYLNYEFAKDMIIFTGWGQAFNAPRLQDMFVQGLHFPGNFFVPNPNLKSEKAETFEIGTKSIVTISEDAVFNYGITYFLTNAQDFIVQDVGATTTTFSNVDNVRLDGAELSTMLQTKEWGLGLSYGQVRSRNIGSQAPLADTPADHWISQIQYYPNEEITFGTDLKYVERQNLVSAGINETPDYFVQDIYAGYKIKKLETNIRINNALDRNYRRHGAGINEVGRDVRLTASYTF